MNVYNRTQTLSFSYRNREQTIDYQWGEGSGEGQDRSMGLRDTNYCVKKREATRIYFTAQRLIAIIL